MWVVLTMLTIGLIFTLSRGAWVGAAAGILVIFSLRGQWKTSLKILLLLAPAIIVVWLMLPEGSREYATDLDASAYNIKARWVSIDFAMGYFKSSPIIGVGVGLRKIYDATNLVMSTLAETGVIGLAAFLSIFCTLLWMAWKASRRLSPDDATRSLLLIGIGLVICKFVHGLVDHYWSRGILPAWAGAGMVVYAYRKARKASIASATVQNNRRGNPGNVEPTLGIAGNR
jgi:O-antigen ligase